MAELPAMKPEDILRKLDRLGNVSIWHGYDKHNQPLVAILPMDQDGLHATSEEPLAEGETLAEAVNCL